MSILGVGSKKSDGAHFSELWSWTTQTSDDLDAILRLLIWLAIFQLWMFQNQLNSLKLTILKLRRFFCYCVKFTWFTSPGKMSHKNLLLYNETFRMILNHCAIFQSMIFYFFSLMLKKISKWKDTWWSNFLFIFMGTKLAKYQSRAENNAWEQQYSTMNGIEGRQVNCSLRWQKPVSSSNHRMKWQNCGTGQSPLKCQSL